MTAGLATTAKTSTALSAGQPASTTVPISVFEAAYAGMERFLGIHEAGAPPWEIGGPQPGIVALAEADLIRGKVLDVGCGTGENALHLAARGFSVVGVDASPSAIAKARAKAEQIRLPCRFLVGDALALDRWYERFDTVIDSGLLYVFSVSDSSRLVTGVRRVLRRGGRYHLMCFSRRKPLPAPRRLKPGDILDTFKQGWRLERLFETRYEVRDGLNGPNAWLASMVRIESRS